VVGSCEHGNKPSGSVLGEELFNRLRMEVPFYFLKNLQEIQDVLGGTDWLLSFDTIRIALKTTRPSIFSTAAWVFFSEIIFLPSRCLATIREYTYRYTHWWEGFMKYAAETGSAAKFRKDWFRHSKVDSGDTSDSTATSEAFLYSFKIKKER
jgi:hypothetical protein